MKYTLSLDIQLSLQRVIELFDNPDNWKSWQESLISFEPIVGTPGEEGSKTKLIHTFGRPSVKD